MPDSFEIALNVTLLDAISSPRPLTLQENRDASLFVTRAVLVEAVRHTLEMVGIDSPLKNLELRTGQGNELLLRPYDERYEIRQRLDLQEASLKSAGVGILAPWHLRIQFENYSLEFRIENQEEILGSYESFKRIFVSIGDGLKDLGISGVIAAVLTGAILAGSGDKFEPHRYYCTVGTSVQGAPNKLVIDASEDLKMPANPTAEQRRKVWKARQSCLRSAGADVGPRDGIYGSQTQNGEREFASRYGGIIVDWESAVFRHFVIQQAMKHQGKNDRPKN